MSPLPPGRIAKIGPLRPDVENSKPPPVAIIGIDSIDVPACFHNSSPVTGSYDVTSFEPLKISSSRLPILQQHRIRPTHRILPLALPDFLARSLVERGTERLPLVLILNENDQVLVEHRRGGRTVRRRKRAQIDVPQSLAVQIAAEQARVAEEDDHALAIGHRRGGGQRVLPIQNLVLCRPRRGVLPEQLAS